MAFTETQKDQIRQYLGFSAGYYISNHRLEGMLDKVGGNAVEQASVEALLMKLGTVETAIATAGSSSTAIGALKRADDVEFYNTTGDAAEMIVTARSYGRILVNRLAARLGFTRAELPSDYFGSGSPSASGEMALG